MRLLVMCGAKMFSPIIGSVSFTFAPVITKILQVRSVPHSPIFHVCRFGGLGNHNLVDEPKCGGIVCLNRGLVAACGPFSLPGAELELLVLNLSTVRQFPPLLLRS